VNRTERVFLILTIALISAAFLMPGEVRGQLRKKPSFVHEAGRDPFSLPAGIRLHSQESQRQEEKVTLSKKESPPATPVEPPLKLKAILIGDHIRLASIDRFIVTVGDSVNDEKVLEIRPDRVILGKEGKTRAILLDQSRIKLTVEEK
jgi:hypothetical protein